MAGALLVTMFCAILKCPHPILADGFALPKSSVLDVQLLGGAALFGLGWGLSGFCPGPAVAALVTELTPVFAFVVAIMVGMALHGGPFEQRDLGHEE